MRLNNKNINKLIINGSLASRLPFIVFIVLGGSTLYLMKLSHLHQTLVSSTSIAFIALYAAIVYYIPEVRLREDNIGDNCYYLGFIYTLGSLIWALDAFSKSRDTNEIIANFALALVSTVFGIAMRVIISQTMKDVVETDRESRIELSSAALRMRSKIDESVLALDTFCRTIQQMTEANIRDTTQKSSDAINACVKKVNVTSELILKKINQSTTALESTIFNLNSSTKEIEKSIIETTKKISSISIPKDLVSKQLEQATSTIESALNDQVNEMKKHNNAIFIEVNKSQSMTNKLANTLSELTDSITDKIK
jgi:hypothetical protein